MSLDLFCVKALVGDDAQTGFYTSAVALAKTPYFIFLGLTSTLFPSLSKSIADSNKELTMSYINQALRFLSLLAIPLVFLVIATSQNLILLAFSHTYLPAAPLLSILIIGLTFFTFFITLSTIMIADNKPYLIFYIALPLIALDFLLNLKLIPIYGTVGAAWATTLTTLIGMVIVAGFVFHRFRTIVNPVSVLKAVVGSFVIYTIARLYQAPHVFLLIEYIVLFGLYVVMLFLMKEIKKRDMEALMLWAKVR
jgi:O-antigen/teichoic acid export membrane protein